MALYNKYNEEYMQKYIFKNYDHILENLRSKVVELFQRDKKEHNTSMQLSPIEIIESEIRLQEENLEQKESIEQKEETRKILLLLYIEKKALTSSCKYIKRANEILKDGTDDSAYEALDYLERVPVKTVTSEDLNNIHIFKALIYEFLEEFEESSKEYKKALKYDKTPNTLIIYKKFVERSREVKSWYKKEEKYGGAYNVSLIHKITDIKDMPKVVESLENIAKYYARSPKSRLLGKKYFREVLKMLKILSNKEPEKYTCKYVEALLDAVDIFMMPPFILKEASELLKPIENCKESRTYLIERLKNLKKKTFIKSTININTASIKVA